MKMPGSQSWPSPDWPEFILRSLPIGVLTVDASLTVTFMNPWAERLTGFSADEVVGKPCGTVVRGGHCDKQCPLRTAMGRTITAKGEPVSVDTTVQSKSGREVPVRLFTAAMFDQEGRLRGAVETFFDLSRVRALEAERERTLSLFAHDMKSPLTAVGGLVDRLLAGKVGELDQRQRSYLERVQRQVERVYSLVVDFLDSTRLREGGVELNFSDTDLARLLEDLIEDYRLRASQKELELELRVQPGLPPVPSDPVRLGRAVGNLVDNAIKYSQRAGKVRVEASQVDDRARIEVVDNGPGLSEEDQRQLFHAFHRGSASSGVEGSGLGLAAVRAIAQAHRGRVYGGNAAEGGAKFVLELPLSQPAQEEPEAPQPQ
jgi:two-component system phosphate regulon sensor histidine kinase PhoR